MSLHPRLGAQRQIHFAYAKYAITPNISQSVHLFELVSMATLTQPKETIVKMGPLKPQVRNPR